MVNRKIKFKISLKELAVEFEGDIQTAERFQQQVTGAINNLATASNRLLSSGQQQAATDVIDVSPTRRRRRRRPRSPETSGGEESATDLAAAEGGEEAPARKAARRDGQTTLINALVTAGYFSEPRTAGEIRDELRKRGHSFKSNELSPTLVRLTREEALERNRNNDNQWAYFVRS
jgi:hypothetical protein